MQLLTLSVIRNHSGLRLRLGALGVLSLLVSLTTPDASANDFWPRLKGAQEAYWGSLISIENGESDRCLWIEVRRAENSTEQGGSEVLRIVERAGRLPHATPLAPGDTGLFLVNPTGSPSVEFPGHQGWIAGFWRLEPGDPADLFGRVAGRELAGSPQVGADLLALVEATSLRYRLLGLSALRWSNTSLSASEKSRLSQAFYAESDPRGQAAFLELFLLKEWPLAPRGLAQLVLEVNDPEVQELTLYYLSRFRNVETEAELIVAYPAADKATRLRLIKAYGRLQIEEATNWWYDALIDGDAELAERALECLGQCGSQEAREIFIQLLSSNSLEVRKAAIRGLATIGCRASSRVLRDYLDSLEPESAEAGFVSEVLKHPYRFGRVRVKVRNP